MSKLPDYNMSSGYCDADRVDTRLRSRSELDLSEDQTEKDGLIEKGEESTTVYYHLAKDDAKFAKADQVDNIQMSLAVIYDAAVLIAAKVLQIPVFTKFFTLQHRVGGTDLYDIGPDDFYIVVTFILNFLLVRSFLMSRVLTPLAKSYGISKFKAIQRFKEQGWLLIYYVVSWGFGFYLYLISDYRFSADALYTGWPHNRMTFLFKLYYLLQAGCWLEQIIVLNIEEKRKDYYQMFSHHIITSCLVIGSYNFYFTRVGHTILLLMDVVDIFLSLAKVLKYCGIDGICDFFFGVFMVTWIILRHGFYNYIFWHACTKATGIMNRDCSVVGPGEICYTQTVINTFFGLLGGLQILALIWLCMILKVAYRVVTGGSAEDVRSDDESD